MKYLSSFEEKEKELVSVNQGVMVKKDSSSIAKLISLFNITGLNEHANIDILSIDFSIPKIVLIDQDTKVIYVSELTNNSKLINYSYDTYQFISITEQHHDKTIEYLYDLNYNPIVEKISYPNGKYELSLTKEYQQLDTTHHYKKAIVRYSEAMNYNGNKLMQPLLTKVTKDNYSDNKFDYRVENTFTYGDPALVYKLNPEDNYSYQIGNSIIYGTNESEEKGIVHYFCGVCFEDFKKVNHRYMPYSIEVKDFSSINDSNIKSGIIFKGGTGDAFHHVIEIYKSDDFLNVKYHVSQSVKDESDFYSRKDVISHDVNLPVQNSGMISSSLLRYLASYLVKQFSDDIFMKKVVEKLEEFAFKIDIKNNEATDIMNSLDSQMIIDMSIGEIIALIEGNEINYFEAMKKELERMIKVPLENIKEKKLD